MMASTRTTPSADPVLAPLAERVTGAMGRLHVPGVAVGVLHEGREHVAGFGVTNVEHPLPVDGDTLFQIGSTTKTVTATAALRLVEGGQLDLDAPVRTYLPELRLAEEGVAARVTPRHLFSHTAGWLGDYFDDLGNGDDALARIVDTMAELPQLTPLGAVWSYNNAGFYLAGRVIEVVAGKSYEDAVEELVLDPLGMTSSFFFPADVMTHRFAAGHIVREDDRPEVARPWPLPRAANPAGGLASTARDQLRYARFHLGDGTAPDGTRLLSPESMAEMQAPAVPAGSMAGAVGITWMVKDVGGTRLVRHGGATKGQLSAFVMAPGRGFAITVLTNANRGGELHTEVVKWALEHYLGVVEPAPEPLALSAAELAPYAGRYSAALSDAELSVRDGALTLQVIPKGGFPTRDSPPSGPTPPPVRLALLDGDGVVALDPPLKDSRGEFLRGPDGAIAWFRFGGRIAARQRQ
jgi:CubicO group peptidase (beta-lactamase class C family)